MISFKLGDWVISTKYPKASPIKIQHQHAIDTGIFGTYTNTKGQANLLYSEECMPWQPETGEWCWFYTNKLTTGRVVAPVLKQYREGDEHMIQERLIRNGNFTNIDDKFAFYQLELIEPFIGQLPLILKDNS